MTAHVSPNSRPPTYNKNMAPAKKNPAAVAPQRKSGKKGDPPKAARTSVANTSDQAALTLLARIKTTNDPAEIRRPSDQLERVIFHKQFENAKTE